MSPFSQQTQGKRKDFWHGWPDYDSKKHHDSDLKMFDFNLVAIDSLFQSPCINRAHPGSAEENKKPEVLPTWSRGMIPTCAVEMAVRIASWKFERDGSDLCNSAPQAMFVRWQLCIAYHFNQDCRYKASCHSQADLHGNSETQTYNSQTAQTLGCCTMPSMWVLLSFLAVPAYGIAFTSKAELRAAVVAWEANTERLPSELQNNLVGSVVLVQTWVIWLAVQWCVFRLVSVFEVDTCCQTHLE